LRVCEKIVSVKDLMRTFRRIYGSGDEYKRLQNVLEQTPESGIKEEFFHCVMDKEIACWAIVHTEGIQCDVCKNQHLWDELCDKANGECNKCKAGCICHICDGKSHFVFSPEKAQKVREKMEEAEKGGENQKL